MPNMEAPKKRLCHAFTFVPLLCLTVLLLAAPAAAQDEEQAFDPHPLRPADTSSPRDTLHSFRMSVNEAIAAREAGEPREAVVRPAKRALETLDLSEFSERGRRASEIEALLLLKEILDRIELPAEEEIPGDAEVADKDKALTHWSIPNTRITIAKVKEGARAGEFLFTVKTVDRLKEFYEDVRHLPYKRGGAVGIYEDVLSSPGVLVPHSWVKALPGWSKTIVLGQAIWQWLVLAIVVFLAFVVVLSLLRWGHRWDKRHQGARPLMRFGGPVSVLASVLVAYLCRGALLYGASFSGDFWIVLSYVIWASIFIGLGWLVFLVNDRIAAAINDARKLQEGSIDAQLMQTLLMLTSLVIVVFLVFYAAHFFGIPTTPVLASLGIGGLAIALAVRPTLENIIGGLTLFADRPVRVGDFCRYGDKMGWVEEIGLRSTRVRALDRKLVSIPNAEFSQMQLENATRRDKRLYKFMLGLRYETTPDQLRFVLAKVREMLLGHPRIDNEPIRVRFHSFGAYSLDVYAFAHVNTPKIDEYLAIREDLNLRIIDIVAEAGTGFAFPSQTAYLGRDTGLDAERGQQAETEVRAWRSKGRLPFPEFDESLRGEMENVLAYPPEGSHGHQPGAALSEAPEEPQPSPPRGRRRVGHRLGFGAKRRS